MFMYTDVGVTLPRQHQDKAQLSIFCGRQTINNISVGVSHHHYPRGNCSLELWYNITFKDVCVP